MRTWMTTSASAACFVAIALQFGCGSAVDNRNAGKKPVQVFAAASASNAICDIKQQFTAATGINVQSSFGSSATLAKQIINGADADVFLSADVKWADDLSQKGLVAKKQNLLGNRLVIVVPNDSKLNVKKAKDLASKQILHIAMGEPKSVPAGKYAKKALEKLGLWEKVQAKIAAADDVRNALTYVETGAAEAGIVYATDAVVSKKVRVVVEIPESLTGPVRYPIVLLKRDKNTAAVESFYKFLSSPESLKVFRKYGFSILND
jgi:molybdate transport system substrate-binding protein